jgi:phosphoribosylanthranilate isomerase
MYIRVKICGITNPQDAQTAVALGADAIGLVFYPASPRFVTLAQAAEITRELPPFVTIVGLFVDADAQTIAQAIAAVPLNLLQFHGKERAAECGGHGLRWIKAVRMREGIDLDRAAAQYRQGAGLLLDAYRPGVPGGTGESFDWDRVPRRMANRIVLAGGLTPDNVIEAVARVRPYAVDVSGGVESEPGRKDAAKIAAFIRGVRLAER